MAVERPPWWRRIFGRGEKAASLPFVAEVPRWRNVTWEAPRFRRLADEGYSKNGAVFACVSALAMAYPEPPEIVVDAGGATLADHSLTHLLHRPNPLMSAAELDIFKIVYCAIGGSCYLHKIRSRAGRVVELWPYHAGQLRPVPSPTNWVSHYEYIGDGDVPDELRQIAASEIIHLKWPSVDLLQPWLPLPPLMAIAREVDTTGEIGRYLYALLANDAVGRTVVSMPPGIELKDAQFERLRQQFEARHGGDNRGRALFVEGGAKIDRMALNLEEMAWEALSRVPEARIAAGFRVPAIIAGLLVGLEKATYANFSEARKVFAQDTCVPLWRHHDDEMTQGLAGEFGPGLRIGRDLSHVAALQENADALYGRALRGWDGGLMTRNEARLIIGLPRIEDLVLPPGAPALPPGDVFVDSVAMAPLALPAPRDVTPEDQRAALPWLSAKDRRLVKRAGDSTEPIEPRIAEALEGYLESQYDLAADGVAAATGSPAEIVDQLGLDLGSGIATLMRRFYRLLIGAAWVDAGTTLALDLVFDLENPLIQTVLGQLARRVTRVAETTREEIRALVGLQAAEGWSVERLAREIRAAGVTRCPARARLIAATETAEAYSLGSKAAYQEAGVVTGVRWLTTEDACPICSPLNGKTAPLDGDFGGGISHPPAHPGCRCAIAPVL